MKLKRSFFLQSAKVVAENLIGSILVLRRGPKVIRYCVIETEAYLGPHDLACHTARGKTKRTEVMFGPGGYAYIYLIYGMYWMLNVVTGKTGEGEAVLIRGLSELDGGRDLSGPGKLTKALRITKSWNAKDLCSDSVYFEQRKSRPCIQRTPRIGVAYAGVWAKKKLRYVMKH